MKNLATAKQEYLQDLKESINDQFLNDSDPIFINNHFYILSV